MSNHAVFLVVLAICCGGALLAVAFLVGAVVVSAREAEQEDGRWR